MSRAGQGGGGGVGCARPAGGARWCAAQSSMRVCADHNNALAWRHLEVAAREVERLQRGEGSGVGWGHVRSLPVALECQAGQPRGRPGARHRGRRGERQAQDQALQGGRRAGAEVWKGGDGEGGVQEGDGPAQGAQRGLGFGLGLGFEEEARARRVWVAGGGDARPSGARPGTRAARARSSRGAREGRRGVARCATLTCAAAPRLTPPAALWAAWARTGPPCAAAWPGGPRPATGAGRSRRRRAAGAAAPPRAGPTPTPPPPAAAAPER